MPSYIIPEPYGLQFQQWGAVVAEQLAEFAVRAPQDDDWAAWGAELLNVDEMASANVPSPYGFSDWQAWASLVLDSLR